MNNQYIISAFQWDVTANTFFVHTPIREMHPVTRKQFYIVNRDTGGFRRFRWIRDIITLENDVMYYEFESEDGIKCHIREYIF